MLIMIYLSTRSIVEAINHWGKANDNNQTEIMDYLKISNQNTSNLIED